MDMQLLQEVQRQYKQSVQAFKICKASLSYLVLSLGNWLSLSLRLYDKSRMMGDYHVRFCERDGVEFLVPT